MILEAKGLDPIHDGAIPGETHDRELSDRKAIQISHFRLSGQFSDSGSDTSSEKKSSDKKLSEKKRPKAEGVSDKLTLSVSKSLDSSSPALMIAYCHQLYATGSDKMFPKLTIVVRKAGGNAGADRGSIKALPTYLELIFEDVRMGSYDCNGSHGSNLDMPSEEMSFQFKRFSMQYWSQDAAGQKSPRMRIVEWNFFRDSH